MRTFIAIVVPQEIREALTDFQTTLNSPDSNVRWVKPEQMHVTLKFLGEIDDRQAEEIKLLLEVVSGEYTAFDVAIRAVGAFPNFRRPSVLWAGIGHGAEQMTRLANSVEYALSTIDIPRERRGFTPHLTLGRVKSPRAIGEVVNRMQRDPNRQFGSFKVESITLIRSELHRTGAVYSPIADFPLG